MSLEKKFLTKILPSIIIEISKSENYEVVENIAKRYKVSEETLVYVLQKNVPGLDEYMLCRNRKSHKGQIQDIGTGKYDPFSLSLIYYYFKHIRGKNGKESKIKGLRRLVRISTGYVVDFCSSSIGRHTYNWFK